MNRAMYKFIIDLSALSGSKRSASKLLNDPFPAVGLPLNNAVISLKILSMKRGSPVVLLVSYLL